MQNKTSLTIIILNYNTPDLVAKCLQSLDAYVVAKSPYAIEVVVVDNGSEAASLKTLEEVVRTFSFVRLLVLAQNKGFAGGNNVALQQVKTTYAMLLNSDTAATAQTHLDKLIEYMEMHPEAAVITPRLELGDGRIDWASHRGEPTPWASLAYFSGLEHVFPKVKLFSQYHLTHQNLKTIHPIAACSGAAMLVRTSAMKKVGELDEQFFMYAEDLDWCKRFREAGYQVVYFPDSLIIHHKYQSGRGHQDQHTAKKTSHHFYDTMLQYFDKHYQNQYPKWVRHLIKLFITWKKGVI